MVIVAAGFDQRSERLGRINRADWDPGFYARRHSDFRSVECARALDSIEVLEDGPVMQADPHPVFLWQSNFLEQPGIKLGLDFRAISAAWFGVVITA
jgi:hypothetical protein